MKILFYSPDSYGLGHVRRTITLAGRILEGNPGSSALVLTGAPRAHYFNYPSRCDYLKLPTITKDAKGMYVAGELDMSLQELVELRGRLILEAARALRPDVLVVDHSPNGLGGEVLPALRELPRIRPGAIRVLGLRDVIDEPSAVRNHWERDGTLQTLRDLYDTILVYGQKEVFDPVAGYGIPEDIARKMIFVGYVGNKLEEIADDLPRNGRKPLVLVTVGGGGDGKQILLSFIDGYRSLGEERPFEAVLVTGPLMSPGKRAGILQSARALPGLTVLEHTNDLPALCRQADLVVGMGGYNTVCEQAAIGSRFLIVPRVFPRQEQWVRARALQERGVVTCLHPDDAADSRRFIAVTLAMMGRPAPPPGWNLDLNGGEVVSNILSRLVNSPKNYISRPGLGGVRI